MLQGKLQAATACPHPGNMLRVVLVQTQPTQLRPAALCSWQQPRSRHPGCWSGVCAAGQGPEPTPQQQQEPQQLQQQQQQQVRAPVQRERDLVIPIAVAICLAGYALIALIGLLDSY